MTLVETVLSARSRGSSPVGLGCMSFGGFYGPSEEAETHATLARALDLGMTFWDTANIYGNGVSETRLGAFFATDPGARRRVQLATKFGISRTATGGRLIDNSESHLVASLEASLKRLRVDHVDLYYLHRYDPAIPIEETVGALARQVEAGKIGAIGLSEIAPDTLRRAHAVHPIAAVQSEYSLWTRSPELGLVQTCAELGTLLVAFSPVGRGCFGGRIGLDTVFAPADFRAANPRFTGANWRRNLARLAPFFDLARAWGVAPGTLAIAWVLARGPHVVPIPGTRSVAHLEEDAAAGALDLTADQIGEIERILPVGFAAGERYTEAQWMNVERYG